MNTDITDKYQSENDPHKEDMHHVKNNEHHPEISEKHDSKNISRPRNKLDIKVHHVGVNQIQSARPILLYPIRKRLISLAPLRIAMDAAAFARYVKQDANNQNELNQLEYIQERIEADREHKEELLEEYPSSQEDIDHQIERIDIQRYDAA